MDRRTFLQGSSALLLPGYSSVTHAGGVANTARFLSCGADRKGDFFVASFLPTGRVAFSASLPSRGHDIAQRPSNPEVVIIARRPGNTVTVVDTITFAVTRQFRVPENRHLYGHGVFSPDGTRFFTTENDFASGNGVIGIYDVGAGYQRLGEHRAGGIGTHQLSISSDGRTITVANGGIRTHPDTGKSKLNIGTMKPNFTFLDTSSGRILQSFSLDKDLHQLSIRHFDESSRGQYAIGMQFEGDRRRNVPLVALLDRRDGFKFLKGSPVKRTIMEQYVGSIRFDTSGSFVAASCPRGNHIVVWNVDTEELVCAFPAEDASGLTATGKIGEFLATGGNGMLYRIDAVRPKITLVADRNINRRWDNHAHILTLS